MRISAIQSTGRHRCSRKWWTRGTSGERVDVAFSHIDRICSNQAVRGEAGAIEADYLRGISVDEGNGVLFRVLRNEDHCPCQEGR
ncbi:hypothetical protein BN2476_140058 [Paraburkholderia piptadeniae]|uniref:Uncharacterized protein n=1 Tax=Paraburkholderia piptadeniae TaxID=1701573 RepID=A0A1N7RRX4_9BURK|nr:hypothetical protein BN2476_140058 [Paraburkholderia piptadeniae]